MLVPHACRPGLLLTAAALLVVMPFLVHFTSDGGIIIGAAAEESIAAWDSDVYDGVWHFWWVGASISAGEDPRFCPLIFYPEGATLAFQNIGWPDTWIMSITGLSGNSPVTAYNISLLLGSILAACGAWWAARQWGVGRAGCLFAALAFVWLPSRMAHMSQHYQLAALGYAAFCLGSVRIWLKEGRWWQATLVLVFSLLACLESAYFILLTGTGVVVTMLLSWKETERRKLKISLLLLVFLASISLAGLFYLTSPGLDGESPAVSWREAIYWSAEPQSWLLPSPYGILGSLSGIPEKFSWMSNSFEGVVTPGLTVLVLFCLAVLKRRRWLMGGLVAFIALLSLGPEFRLLGRPLGIPLPYRLIQLIPLLSGARASSRFAMLAGFFMAIEAGRFFSKATRKWKFVLTGLLLLELMVPTLPALSGAVPSYYRQMDKSDGPVLEIPCSLGIRRYIFFQTADGLPRMLSYMARSVETSLPVQLKPFSVDAADTPGEKDALATGAFSIVYNRWMLSDDEREIFDIRFQLLFEGADTEDSLWIWRRDS